MSSVDGGEFSYAYKSSLMGAPLEFHLAPDALEWRKGGMAGRTPYGSIRRVRLSFRPMTMQNYRFVTEVWPDSGPKLQIASTSWKSLVEHERLDAEYSAFVSELSRRVGAAGGNTAFVTGSPAFLYWPGGVIFTGTVAAVAALAVRALMEQAWGGAAFIAAFCAFFIYQGGNFFRRNRPGTFRPDAVPRLLLPKA
ncbi:MAG TPA: hypothetical protein VJT13_13315 [Xanthobacteraceae bacterium]|nr:hypothetical protein [Xanthobacteraceae bacterium]